MEGPLWDGEGKMGLRGRNGNDGGGVGGGWYSGEVES